MTETEAKWEERVRVWRESGRTAESFVEGQGFEASTLRYWASRLKSKKAAGAASAPVTASPRQPVSVQLVRVRRTRAGSSETLGRRSTPTSGLESNAAMVIVLGAARIEVRAGFDRTLLGELVEVLGGAR
jgi:hypothetical protein